jgi:LysM repeat protein
MQVMSKAMVHAGQSFFDNVVETTGSVENAFEMAILNGISITDDIKVGTELKISKITNNAVANFFNETNRPATALAQVFTDVKKLNYSFPTQY